MSYIRLKNTEYNVMLNFLFSCLETMVVVFLSLCQKWPSINPPGLSYLDRFGAPPHTAEGSRQCHSLNLCHFVSLIHTYLHIHTTHATPADSIHAGFGDTVEILYHSNTIATTTAETKKSPGSAMAEQALVCCCFSRMACRRFTFQHINMIGRPWKAMMFDLLAQKASYLFTIKAVRIPKKQIHRHIHPCTHPHTHNFKHASQKQWNGHMS